MSEKFDPRKFIDRQFEQELFEQLLQFADEARILAIKDGSGTGKSDLLRYFQYRCRTVKPRTPVSFVELDQLSDDSPLALAQSIVEDLKKFGLPFPTFDHYEAARQAHDFTTIRGAVDLRRANLQQARLDVAGVMTKIDRAGPVTVEAGPRELTPEQQVRAQETSVGAFLADLKEYCAEKPVVLMLDAYEKCDADLKTWLIESFLEQHCFDEAQRPAYLLLVIAGWEMPDFELYRPAEDCERVVKSVRGLSQWSKAHVAECLEVHGFSYSARELDVFYGLVEMGYTPFEVVTTARTLNLRRRQ